MKFEHRKSYGYMTNWAARLFARAMDRRLKPIGLSSGHLTIFFALGGGAALPQKRLAELASIEQPTMAATLSRMERDGLIERRPDPKDRRSALISLTPAAMEKVPAVLEAIAAINAQATAGFSETERATYLAMLGRIVDAFEEA